MRDQPGTGPRRRRQRRVLLAVAALVAGGALVQVVTTGTEVAARQAAAQPADEGRQLFLGNCAFCHGARGQGTERAPRLTDAGAAAVDFQLTTGRMPLESADEEPRRQEPAFSPRQIDAIVSYVASLGGGPPIPEINLERADLARGHGLYQENCAACHSASGTGAALTSGRVAPGLQQATPLQVAESIRTGPGAMPEFGPETLDGRELDDIAAYVRHLQEQGNPGGFSLGRIGPVPEGAVAWLLGLGLLVVFVRIIGERTPSRRTRNQTGSGGEEG